MRSSVEGGLDWRVLRVAALGLLVINLGVLAVLGHAPTPPKPVPVPPLTHAPLASGEVSAEQLLHPAGVRSLDAILEARLQELAGLQPIDGAKLARSWGALRACPLTRTSSRRHRA